MDSITTKNTSTSNSASNRQRRKTCKNDFDDRKPKRDHSDRWWKGKYFAAEHSQRHFKAKKQKWLSWAPAITQVFKKTTLREAKPKPVENLPSAEAKTRQQKKGLSWAKAGTRVFQKTLREVQPKPVQTARTKRKNFCVRNKSKAKKWGFPGL